MRTDEQMVDLARQARAAARSTGVAAIAEWTAYLDKVRAAVNEVRALETADLLYLHGERLRAIVEQVAEINGAAPSHQSVAEWLDRYGPKRYAAVAAADDGYAITWVPVTGVVQTRRELAARRAGGHRIAPATWRVTTDSAADAHQLWHQIGG